MAKNQPRAASWCGGGVCGVDPHLVGPAVATVQGDSRRVLLGGRCSRSAGTAAGGAAGGLHSVRVSRGPRRGAGLLGTIASTMITFTSLVFSLTMVILQLASSQFTPRVLGGFLESRVTQAALGGFIATFVFALTVLGSVRGGNDTEQFVPQVAVTVAFVMVLTSVVFFSPSSITSRPLSRCRR